MKLSQPAASIVVPDALPVESALRRTTHLGIGAHPDDLEFMALHGILECYDRADQWFGGITCTQGGGSVRAGKYAACPDAEWAAARRREQNEAARIGQYAFIAQLDHAGGAVRSSAGQALEKDLQALFSLLRPRVIYTHNLADKHATHVAVTVATLRVLRALPPESRPQRVLGCEVWSGLDWLPDDRKVILDVSAHEELALTLVRAFDSQLSGGKRYDLAVPGRQRANATFLDPRAADRMARAGLAMDLTPLIRDERLEIGAYVDSFTRQFAGEIRDALRTFLSPAGK